MSTTLANINTLINDRRRDTGTGSIDMSTVGFRAINSTLNIWNELHDWPWSIKQLQFNYNPGIDTYALDNLISDFKYPITLKYYKPNQRVDEFWFVSPNRFDSAILFQKRFTVPNIAGVQQLRVKASNGNSTSLNTATAYNQNGTWVGASAIGTVATDAYEGYSLPSSVSFLFNGTSGTLTNDGNTFTTFKPLNLSSYQNRSNIYFDIDIPAVTNLTSISLKWGTDSSNYYTATATTNYVNQPFATGWTKVKMPWSTPPTTVGTPTITSIKYLQLTVTCSGSTNLGLFRVQNFIVSENIPLLLTYYSTYMVNQVSDSTQFQVFPVAANTSDTPMWTGRWDVATEAFINSVLEIVFWITGEQNDMQAARQKIQDLVEPLKKKFPSQRRYPTMQVVTDTNYQSGWDSPRAKYNNGSTD